MLVVADDLSGAVETAAVLGVARVTLDPRDVDGAVVDLDSRHLPAAEAARRVRAIGARIAFKKIDSQLRGNVAAELAALDGEVIVAPALPVEGRIVRGGVLYVNGEARASPVALVDAETDADLDAIVAAAPPGATLVGSAGLAAALGRKLGVVPLPPPTRSGRTLFVVVGTRAAGEQLKRLNGVVTLTGPAERLAELVAETSPVDLVLTGGETARRVLDALGVTELFPIAQVHHGAVQCETADGRRVLIRPGSFGGPDSLVRIVDALT